MSERASNLILAAIVVSVIVMTLSQLAGADLFMEVSPGFFWE
tara:strand:+ start:2637 stop:2762 length:126 start_codon:yes stop_codon:yes gene_type:complete